jgi:rRNA maturation endonuclease Nob1
MNPDVGIACGSCDTLNVLAANVCNGCGHGLMYLGQAVAERADASRSVLSETGFSAGLSRSRSEEDLMEQARNYVCKECSTSVPSGHKFCGTCGAAVPIEVVELRIKFFGAMA